MESMGMAIMGVLTSLAQLFIIVICIYYLIKKTSLDGVFMLLGSIITLLLRIFYMMVLPGLLTNNILSHESWVIISPILSLIGFFAEIIFGIGLLILINKFVKK